jgi:PAS domain S-box-containing protein
MPADERDREIGELRHRLEEAEATLLAIREGQVDAIVVQHRAGDQIYTLRGAEQPYRLLVEQMMEGAATLTPEGDVFYCNRRLAELVGLPLEQVIGTRIERFLPEEERAALRAMLHNGHGTLEAHLQAVDGTRYTVHLSVTIFTIDTAITLSLVVTDVTDLVRTRRAQVDAEAASRARDEFMAMLAHELRNPVGAISSAIHILDGAAVEEEPAARARAVIRHQVARLTRLIGDLVDVARITMGKIAIVLADFDVAAIVQQSVNTLRAGGELDNHLVSVESRPVWVRADAARVEQIVINLLTNAVKFTPAGGTIRVTVSAEGDDAVIEVADAGIGIAGSLLPRLFDLFVQGERGLDRAGSGLGIGLALVRRVAELHGGRAEARSEGPGRGSVFTVRLPVLTSVPSSVPRPETAVMSGARRVLLAEDDADSREMFKLWLEMLDHEVHVAPDGHTAVDLALRLQPDVAFVDIGLPGIDGYEVARRIRAAPLGKCLHLIALSGYGQQEDRRRGIQAGFDAYMVKPLDLDSLTRALTGKAAQVP